MINTGQFDEPFDPPKFLEGFEIEQPVVEHRPAAKSRGAAMAAAIAARGKDTLERTTQETTAVEVLPTELLDSLRALLEQLPEIGKRIEALEDHASAGNDLHAALMGLQQVNQIFSQMNSSATKRLDHHETTLAEMKTMMEPLEAFLLSLDSRRAA